MASKVEVSLPEDSLHSPWQPASKCGPQVMPTCLSSLNPRFGHLFLGHFILLSLHYHLPGACSCPPPWGEDSSMPRCCHRSLCSQMPFVLSGPGCEGNARGAPVSPGAVLQGAPFPTLRGCGLGLPFTSQPCHPPSLREAPGATFAVWMDPLLYTWTYNKCPHGVYFII